MQQKKERENCKKPLFILATILAETSPQAIPLGAACTASSLKTYFGKDAVKLVAVSPEEAKTHNTTAEQLLFEQILSLLSKSTEYDALFIGFSTYVWNAPSCAACVELLKTSKNKPTISTTYFAGGPSANTENYLAHYDFTFTGEGEFLADFLIAEKYCAAPIKKQNTQDNRYVSPWLDGTLAPAEYNGVLWELERGCPYACTYCEEALSPNKVRHSFDLTRLEKEIDFFASVNVPQAFVLSPSFTASKERALAILALMAKKLPNAHFQIEARAEQLDPQLVKAFSKIICSLQIGLQSANEKVLKNVGRAFNRKEFSRKIALLNENGIVFGLDLMYGLPEDTLPSFKDSLEYALSLYPNHLDIFRLSVLPNTKLHSQAAGFGLQFDSEPPHLVRCTPTFSKQDLKSAAELAFACTTFYSAGRAVPWFKAVLQPLKIRSVQFLADFAEWQRCNNCSSEHIADPYLLPHADVEKMQLSFLELKYAEKNLENVFPIIQDIVRLNGALSRIVGDGTESIIGLSYHPEDVLEACAYNLVHFAEEAYMEEHTLRIFAGSDGPDMEIL